ncbi:allantoate amidohydrolase [Pullulanibacillus sp. KACC 23026]|uniref:allantoate amidohydrolase n=1 Tax=Pullulanibacillus sp. KACC 23026 TaxID=3028315 RepID=UPI0023B0CE43|nr:allantoate amidohydrolase [Pullulanibacillus sp. KACC 23026]WEG11816.1 allantoate amidohydrolase [Pullulanibacillus sp. KACC 23026]
MNVQQERLWNRLMSLSSIGHHSDGSGGVTRLSFTKEEREAKDRVAAFMREAGLSVREDAVGNLIGRLEGMNPDSPVLLVGSHLDSVPHGGDFDGPLGVLAAVEALQTLGEKQIKLKSPVEVIAFTDEEGARFRFGMIGSRGLAGTLEKSDLHYVDQDGVSVEQAMKAYGLSPDRFHEAARSQGSVKAYLEVHIEQGKILESKNLPIGIVSGIAGPLWLKFTITGEAGHAGSTPMNLRRDALTAASAIIQAIEEEAAQKPRTVGTVGQLSLKPGGVNIIPGEVEFTLDLRDVDETIRDEVEKRILNQAEQICKERGVHCQVDVLQRIAPVKCDESIQQFMMQVFNEMGLEPIELISGAGHDGMQFKDLCPVGMIFVRSKNGISHHPDEYTSLEDCGLAAEALYNAILKIAERS